MEQPRRSGDGALRVIAVFKLLKALVLIAAAFAAFSLSQGLEVSRVDDWVRNLAIQPGYPYLEHALLRLTSMSPATYRKLGIGSLFYAALFLTEGTGLWLRRRWAEWLTVVITASLVPLEVYGITRRPTVPRILATVVNVAIVVYLLRRIRKTGKREAIDGGLSASPTKPHPAQPA